MIYYLCSSALGGRIITEYDSAGARQTSYAYAGAEPLAVQEGVDTTTPTLSLRHTNPVTGDGRKIDPSGRVTAETHVDTEGVDVGNADPFAGEAGEVGGSGEGMSQGQIDAMVASLMPGWGGKQCKLSGFLMGCGLVNRLVESGLAAPGSTPNVLPIYSRSLGRYVGLAVYNPQAAANGIAILGAGSLGYLPVGSTYTQGVGIQFQSWFGSLFDGGNRLGSPEPASNFISETSAQIRSLPFIEQSAQQKSETRGELIYKEENDERGGSKLSPCAMYIFRKLGFQSKIDLEKVRIHLGIPDWITEGAKKFGGIVPGAVTIGNDIYWKKDDYHPNTIDGLALLGHELAHVYQWHVFGDSFMRRYIKEWFKNGGTYGGDMEANAKKVEDALKIRIPKQFGNDPCKDFRHQVLQ